MYSDLAGKETPEYSAAPFWVPLQLRKGSNMLQSVPKLNKEGMVADAVTHHTKNDLFQLSFA